MMSAARFGACLLVLVVAIVWGGWLVKRHVEGRASPFDRIETALLDLRLHLVGERTAPEAPVILAIDDATLAEGYQFPLKRDDLADLLLAARQAGARAAVIDILLSDPMDGDEALVSALSEMPSVLAVAAIFAKDGSGRVPSRGVKPGEAPVLPVPLREIRPLPAFSHVAKTGLVNVATDWGGTPRHVPMVFRTGAGLEPSLVLQSVALYEGLAPVLTAQGVRLGQRQQNLDLAWNMPLNYYGPAGSIETISAVRLLKGELPEGSLNGRLVIIGATAVGVGDDFASPFDPILPGVEVLATGISNLLDGTSLVRNKEVRRIDAIAALVLTLAGVIAFAALPLAMATVLSVALGALWLVGCLVFLIQGYWLNAVLPFAVGLPPVFLMAILRQVLDRRQMRKLDKAQQALGQFQAPALARRIAEDPHFLAEPREQAVTILFVDLAGYTGLSEQLGPSGTREVLKGFHTLVVNESRRWDGVVLDFMGDGAMIGFGIPDSFRQDAANAFGCAFDLVRAVHEWRTHLNIAEGAGELRVGGHSGWAVLSRLGHDSQQQIAVTGDCVNVASRLMEVGKTRGAQIVLSGDLCDQARDLLPESLKAWSRSSADIRGRAQDLQVACFTAQDIEDLQQGLEKPRAVSENL